MTERGNEFRRKWISNKKRQSTPVFLRDNEINTQKTAKTKMCIGCNRKGRSQGRQRARKCITDTKVVSTAEGARPLIDVSVRMIE